MDVWLYITIIVAFSLIYFGYENKKKYELKGKEIELEQKYLELEMKKIEKGVQTQKQSLD